MLVTQREDGKFQYVCECGWKIAMAVHVPVRHKCKTTNQLETYVPPDHPELKRSQEFPSSVVIASSTPAIPTPRKKTPKEPSMVRKIGNFTKASIKHIRTGKRQATDEQVNARFSICETNKCGFFKSEGQGYGKCLHPTCGCGLRMVGVTGRNKLRWAEQECPVGLWKEIPKEEFVES